MEIVDPARNTGSSTANGVTAPVRPTLTSILRSTVVACAEEVADAVLHDAPRSDLRMLRERIRCEAEDRGSVVAFVEAAEQVLLQQGMRPPELIVARREEDLGRRDFRMNAMALDRAGSLRDPYGGRDDIAARRLRMVGDPREILEEDPLRMLRAARFIARFGFTPHADLRAASAWLQERRSELQARGITARTASFTVTAPGKELARLATELDHIVPLCKGGNATAESNLQGLCRDCHADKTAMDFGRNKYSRLRTVT